MSSNIEMVDPKQGTNITEAASSLIYLGISSNLNVRISIMYSVIKSRIERDKAALRYPLFSICTLHDLVIQSMKFAIEQFHKSHNRSACLAICLDTAYRQHIQVANVKLNIFV